MTGSAGGTAAPPFRDWLTRAEKAVFHHSKVFRTRSWIVSPTHCAERSPPTQKKQAAILDFSFFGHINLAAKYQLLL